MNKLTWTKRTSNTKTNRISYTQFLSELGCNRQSRSIERASRIPLRSFSQSGKDKNLQNQNKQRSRSQIPVNSSETPLSHGKCTPSQYTSSKITSGASSNVSSKKPAYYKDPRNLQDKEFLKEASQLVQSYFQEKCPEILINNSEIKPMTIKMFIAMINHLFEVLEILDRGIEPVRFSVSTYEKELPYWMKKLEYPGLITKAWLQTVNVPQYWPHVVGLLSWLVKLCSVNALYNMEEQLSFPPEQLNECWTVFLFKKSMEGFIYSNDGKEEEYKALYVEVINKFKEFNGINEDDMQEVENEIAEVKMKLEDPVLLANKDAYDQLELQLRNVECQHQKLLEDIQKKELYIEELKNKHFKIEKNCTLIKSEIEDARKEQEALKKTISTQAISVEDIADIEKKSGYLDKEIKCLEKECEDYYQLINRYNVEAAAVRDKVLQSSHAFNRNIIQLEQIIPELKDFHVHVEFENKNVVSDMEKMVRSLEGLKNTYVEKYQNLDEEISELQKSILEKNQVLKELQNQIKNQENKNELKQKEILEIQKSFEEKENKLKEEADTWNDQIIAAQKKIKEFDDLKEKNNKSELRYESMLQTLEEKKQQWHNFWVEVKNKWKAIPDDLELFLDMVTKQNEELKNALNKGSDVEG